MISKATLSRIPGYLKHLKELPASVTEISATTLARQLSLGEVQVRKDLASVCGKGKPKIGYKVADLIRSMERVLPDKCLKEAIIVGAGKLGAALLGYPGFAEYGLKVAKAFDNDEQKFGNNVLPMSELGILTVPAAAAQEATDEMIKSGIRAVWCFSRSQLQVPEGVTVQYEDLALSLAHLQNKIK